MPLEFRDPLLAAWAQILQLFPAADISARERQSLWWLLRRVFAETVATYTMARQGAPVDDAFRVALSYIAALRPSLKDFRVAVRRAVNHRSEMATAYHSLATALLPVIQESRQRFEESPVDAVAPDQWDPSEAFARDLCERLRLENKRRVQLGVRMPFPDVALAHITADLYHCDARRRGPRQSDSVDLAPPRPHVVARVLAARVLGRRGRKRQDLSEQQLERLWGLGRSCRVVSWETPEAAAIAERIVRAKS